MLPRGLFDGERLGEVALSILPPRQDTSGALRGVKAVGSPEPGHVEATFTVEDGRIEPRGSESESPYWKEVERIDDLARRFLLARGLLPESLLTLVRLLRDRICTRDPTATWRIIYSAGYEPGEEGSVIALVTLSRPLPDDLDWEERLQEMVDGTWGQVGGALLMTIQYAG